MIENLKLNKFETFLKPYYEDGQVFNKQVVTELLNLPAEHPTLTPAIKGRLSRSKASPQPEPIAVPKFLAIML